MKGKLFVCALVILANIVLADCQSNNGWPTTAPGEEAELACTGDFIGKRTRKCSGDGVWQTESTEYCLPKYPSKGSAYVDFVLYIPKSNIGQIQKDQGEGIKQGFLSVYTNLGENEVSVYRIVRVDSYSSVQVRIATSESKADSIYKELGATKEQCTKQEEKKGTCSREHPLYRLEDHLSHNNQNYHYLTGNAQNTDYDIFIPENEGPYKNEAKAKNNMATVIIIIVVIIVIIVGVIAGFYIWLQIKRNGPRNGSKQLKATSKV